MKGPLDTQDEVPAANSASNTGEGFSEYMWMAEEGVEDFDKKCEEEFLNDRYMDLYLQQMLEDEEEQDEEEVRAIQDAGHFDANGWWYPPPNCQPTQTSARAQPVVVAQPQVIDPAAMLAGRMQRMELVHQQQPAQRVQQRPASSQIQQAPVVSSSKLNPNAAVFVPRFLQATADDR